MTLSNIYHWACSSCGTSSNHLYKVDKCEKCGNTDLFQDVTIHDQCGICKNDLVCDNLHCDLEHCGLCNDFRRNLAKKSGVNLAK